MTMNRTQPQLPTRSLRSLLAGDAATASDSQALVLPSGQAYTYGQLYEAVEELSAQLPRAARIGVRLANDAASLVAVHAVLHSGGSVVAIGKAVPEAEAQRRLHATGAMALLEPAAEELAVAIRQAENAPVNDRRSDEALIMFTSGTTGVPKAASISAGALETSVRGIATGSGLPADGRAPRLPPRSPQPVFVPIGHMGGLLGTVTSWWLGKPILLCPKFSVSLVEEITRAHRIGVLRVTPAMVYELAHADRELALPGVTSVTVGTAALPERTQQEFEQRFGIPILRNYGQTEFAGAIAFERPDDVAAGRRPPGTVGRAAPGVQIRIVGPDGSVLPTGEVGEIHACSPSSMSGYLGADGTSDAAGARWLATGDLGRLDDDGFLTIVGRVRDVILCGGFNIYPAQLEAALNTLPAVLDSAVAALPDDRLGEIPVAAVVAASDASLDEVRVRAELRARLAAYELPRRVRIVSSLPRLDSGKVDRAGVVRLFEREMQQEGKA